MRALIYIQILFFVVGAFVGCGDKKSGGSARTPTPSNVCQIGQVYNSQYGCLSQGTCPSGYGYVPSTNQCVAAQTNYPTHSGSLLWGQRMQITNSGVYKQFLKDNWVCDYYNIANWGTADCDAWDSTADVYLGASSTTLPTNGSATIVAYSDMWGMTSGGYQLPISGTIYPINTNSGFELRTTGGTFTPSYNSYIQVIADPGTLTSNQIAIRLLYQGTEFGRATVNRF